MLNRRGFLSLFARGLAAVPLLPATAVAASSRQIVLQQSPVAGFQHHAGEKVFARLREGMPLRLVREPENKYDKRAVAVYAGKHKLGYVPRIDNAAIAQMLDRGDRLRAYVVQLQESHNPWDRIRFEVALDG